MILDKLKNNIIIKLVLSVIAFFILAIISFKFLGIVMILGGITRLYYLLKKSDKYKQFSRLKKNISIVVLGIIITFGMGFLTTDVKTVNLASNNLSSEPQLEKTVQNTQSKVVDLQKSNIVKEVSPSVVTGQLKIHYINVGQGDSILITQGNHNMLIDTGTNASTNSLMAYLDSQRIKKIDYLVLTHPHEDHIGGADAVINAIDISAIYMPKVTSTTKTFKDVIIAMKNKDLKATIPQPGTSFKLGDATCTILGPLNAQSDDLNTYSIVIKVTFGSNKFLFTGDAQASNEEAMIEKGYDLSADVLKIGHHGSKTSTSDGFLSAVSPKYAVISVGKGNDYGHPHEQVMSLLNSKEIKVFRTDENGTIICTSNGKDISFNTNPGDYQAGGVSNSNSSNRSSSNGATAPIVSTVVNSAISPSQYNQEKVYVTNSGKKYHRDGCKSLSKSKIPITKVKAVQEGYTACGICNP